MYRAKGGRFMTRSQIIALLLGAGVVIVGVAAWQGVLPGVPHPGATSGATPAGTASPPPSVAMISPSPQPPSPQLPPPQLPPPQSLPPQPMATPDIPMFDTVRVEPSGDTVVAGHGPPQAKMALVAGDKVLAEVDADGAGNFVMVPPPLAPGNYVLALRSTGKDGATLDSHQNIIVSVPPKGQTNVVVALAEPGKPSVVLTDTANPPAPAAAPQPSATAQPEVSFKTAEVDNGGFYASGAATPGAHLRIYLNGSALADVTAGSDGHWSLTVGKGVTPGHYAVRADAIDANGKVLARAEVPFDVPANVAEASAVALESASSKPAPPSPSVPSPSAPSPPASQSAAETPAPSQGAAETPAPAQGAGEAANESGQEQVANAPPPPTSNTNDAVVAQIQTTTVVRGDSLWRISRKVFGHGIRYTLIYEANAKQIRDPSLIYPGQVFVLPHATN
jgi:nucleoid-associated protein YgaU